MISVQRNVSLANHSTMRLGGEAAWFTEVHNENDVVEAVEYAKAHSLPIRVIGSGSNIIWSDDGFRGLIIQNSILGLEISDDHVIAGAGILWDECVEETVLLGLSGLEFLSLIPGTTGAVPVQNVGAYGAEVKDVITNVYAYDLQTGDFVKIPNRDCQFAYRSSRFNAVDKGRFIITKVEFQLTYDSPKPPFYRSLQQYFEENGTTEHSPSTIRGAVIAIRQSKLPDPDHVPNCGSFFKNPIVSIDVWKKIESRHANAPHWDVPTGVKLSAAWLLDQAGFKNFVDESTGMATYEKQPLVLINKHATSANDLLLFRQKLVDGVQDMFGIELEQEPEFVG